MNFKENLHNGYDVFISHNHADKDWTRILTERISKVDYLGRLLRPWLDEQFLDPGNLGQNAELTTALDRSRLLLLVLSPASVKSKYVDFELKYFLKDRKLNEVVPILLADCDIPETLGDVKLLDFTDSSQFEQSIGELMRCLCPAGGYSLAKVNLLIEQAWENALDSDPGGLDAEPSPSRDALLQALLHFSINESATEGLALTGFNKAAELLLLAHENNHSAAYNMTMCLGECLAAAIMRHGRYRQIAQRYLDMQTPDEENPVLAFVVARAYSKLAEIDPVLIDLGTLLRVTAQLDATDSFNNKKATIAMLIGRIAAKIRNTNLGDLLIKTLSEGGAAGRIAAIGGISMAESNSPAVFYSSELAVIYSSQTVNKSKASEPPSLKLQAMLFAIELDQPDIVRQQLNNAIYDLKRVFEIEDLPYGYSWFALRKFPSAINQSHTPLMGMVAKATAKNMEELALRLNASYTVCITEARIVEALFDKAGSLLIPLQEINSPQCRRLLSRNVPFAMLDVEQMAKLKDGGCVEIDGEGMRVVG